jgi:dienelactone hydrolase
MIASRRGWILGAVVVAGVTVAVVLAAHRFGPSAALMLDLSGTPSRWRAWLPAPRVAVGTTDVDVPTRHGRVRARVYRPATNTTRSVLLVPGVHAGDLDEPRLARFSRRLAEADVLVVALPLPDLRRYRVTPVSTDVVEDSALWMAARSDLAPRGRVGLVGISFSGGLAVVAAGRPALDGKIAFVVSLGGHGDLPRVMAYLSSVTARPPDERPPHDYGTAIIALAAIPRLVPAEQVHAAEAVATMFLDASSLDSTDRTAAARAFDEAATAGRALPETARTLLDQINTRDVAAIGPRLAPWIETLGGAPALSPERSPATRAPVFLLHGVDDNVIPSAETPRLARYLEQQGNRHVRWLLTPLLVHADPRADAPLADVWELVRFWTAIMDAF